MRRRTGFSVIEALVVLLIGAAALTLIFQVGVHGSQTGLRLGTRALSTVEAEPGVESLRLAMRGWLPDSATAGLAREMRGDARGWAGRIDLERPILCADAGPARPVEMTLVPTSGGDVLTCRSPAGGEAATLIDLRPVRAAFSYSADGERWSPRLSDVVARRSGERLFVRLSTADGALDIVEEVQALAAGGAP